MLKSISKKNFYVNRALNKLTVGFCGKFGKNFYGRITVYHKSSTYSKKNRILDYKRILCSEGCLFSLETKPTHTGYLGLVFYFIGIFSYIIIPNMMEVGDHYKGFSWTYYKNENFSSFLNTISTGIWVNNVELKPGHGGKLARAAGTGSFVYSKWGDFVFLKVSSGKIIKLSKYCVCVNGLVSNKMHHLNVKRKAGTNRLLGRRPTVRGVAMNPVDHPHGGGEGKKSQPSAPKTPWGKSAKFLKTSKNLRNVKIPL